jgi:hypothetical protein
MAVESVTLSKPQSPRTKPTGGDHFNISSFSLHKLFCVEDQQVAEQLGLAETRNDMMP